MLRRVRESDRFKTHLAALRADPEMARVVDGLVRMACMKPFSYPAKSGKTVRVCRTRAFGSVPAVRLFYRVREQTIRFLDVEIYDEFEE